MTLEHADGNAPKAIAAGVVPSWARGTWRRHFAKLKSATDWRLGALAAAGFIGMVVLSGLLFLAIPRFDIQSSLFIDRLISRTTMSGFSESIQFGDVTAITQDNRLAFSVDISEANYMPAVPYWRMVVLDEYTGSGFKMSAKYRKRLNGYSVPRSRVNGSQRPDYDSPSWTIYMEPGISRYLPLLGNFHTMSFTEPQTFALNDQLRIVALQREPPKMFAYRTWSMATGPELYDASFALARQKDPAVGEEFLVLPAGAADRSRLTQFLRDINPVAPTDARRFAHETIQWLSDIHPYALTSAVPDGEGDTLIRWMDSETPGHCEFFAGSFVMLARAAGFPARIVTGFRGGQWNDYSGSFMVRNSNAHAWAEIFDAATSSWVRFDPTPGNQALADWSDNDPRAMASAIARDQSWGARMESLRVFWYRRIVNFDLDTQAELVSSTKRFFQAKSKALKDWADARIGAVRDWVKRPWDRTRSIMILGWIAAAVAAGFVWQKFGRRWWLKLRRSTNRRSDQDPVRREASRWLRRAAQKETFTWPAEVHRGLLRLRFGATERWPDPVGVFRAARTAWRRR